MTKKCDKGSPHLVLPLDWQKIEGFFLGLGAERSAEALQSHLLNFYNQDISLKAVMEIIYYRKWQLKAQHFDNAVLHKAYEKLIDMKAEDTAKAMAMGMQKSLLGHISLFDEIEELLMPYQMDNPKKPASLREILKMMELNLESISTLERISKTPLMMKLLQEIPLAEANRSNDLTG